jgi:hypothetical protein
MSVTEHAQYTDWASGLRAKSFNKATSRLDASHWNGKEATADQWLGGLREMFKDEDLTREHVYWWAKNLHFLTPTIHAYVKIRSAVKGLSAPKSDLTPAELAEYQTAGKIMAEATYRVQEIKVAIHKLTSQVDLAVKSVQTRIRYYQPRIKEKVDKIKGTPENIQRAEMGKTRLAGPSNLGDLKGRKRKGPREELGQERGARRARLVSPEFTPQEPTVNPLDGMDIEQVVASGGRQLPQVREDLARVGGGLSEGSDEMDLVT